MHDYFSTIIKCCSQVANQRPVPPPTPEPPSSHRGIRVFQNSKTSFYHCSSGSKSPAKVIVLSTVLCWKGMPVKLQNRNTLQPVHDVG